MSGKGDRRREPQVDSETVASNWDRIFGKQERETMTVCATCNEEVHMLPPEGLDYCQQCDRLVEGEGDTKEVYRPC